MYQVGGDCPGGPVIASGFQLFGPDHVCALVVSAVSGVLIYLWGRRARSTGCTTRSAIVLATMLLTLEGYKTLQDLLLYEQPWQELLPLHLCRISSYLCSLMLVSRSYRLFEVTYFWGIGGSLAALLTPDLDAAFPHPLFFGFFAGHALVLSSVLYAISAYQYRPRLRSIGFTAAVTLVYMGAVALINLVLGTNYLYLSGKPESLTAYQYLGPWPWYLLSVWLIGAALAFALYAPFGWRYRRDGG